MISTKLTHLLRDPLGVLSRRVGAWIDRFAYRGAGGYRAEEYWAHRLSKCGCDDLRGVGNSSLTRRENQAMYDQAGQIILALVHGKGMKLDSIRMLDIGCGTGFYARVFRKEGVKHYTGIDITDTLFPELKRAYPSFEFRKQDITRDCVEGMYDLILMVDVTQHIISDGAFCFAMRNIRSHLNSGGILVVTSWLSDRRSKRTFFEVARSLEDYDREFPCPAYARSDPIRFRDKSLLCFRKSR